MIYPRRSPILASRVGKPIPTALAAWYRYNTGITSAGGTVSAWANQTGGEALVQATAENQPFFGSISAELAVNGTFDSDTGWTKPADWTISGGAANKIAGGAVRYLNQSLSGGAAGDTYRITYTVLNYVAGQVTPRITGDGNVVGANRSANGTYTDIIVAGAGSSFTWGFQGNAAFEGSVDNVSIRQTTNDGTISFDGIQQFLKTAPFTLNQPTTVYFLGRQLAWTSTATLFDGNANNSLRLNQVTSTPRIQSRTSSSGPVSDALTLNTYLPVATVFNGASSIIQVANTTSSAANIGATNAGGFTLGAAGAGTSNFGNIQCKEILIYNVAHDANQRAAVIAYLNMVNQL